jgi:2',3'-cyclic-nucleotide 2'-phosphodiesterase (5'-nucleotidase family)
MGDPPFRLTILHFNDLHHRLADRIDAGWQPVFSRIAGRVRQAREAVRDDPHAAVLVLSAGDDVVGTIFDELMGPPSPQPPPCEGGGASCQPSFCEGGGTSPLSCQERGGRGGEVHPAYRLYTAAGVDAATVGNHDLDFGPEWLARAAQAEAGFPVLSANFRPLVAGMVGAIRPAAVFNLKGLRVGVIGVSTPAQLPPRHAGCIGDPLEAVQRVLPIVRPRCDVLIILSHLGYRLAAATALVAGAGDVELAASLPPGSAHLIVGGHTHDALHEHGLAAAHVVNGIPILQAGAHGRYLGEAQVMIREQRGRLAVKVSDARLHPVAELPVDIAFEARHVRPLLDRAQVWLDRPLGRVADHPDLALDTARAAFASGESALANFLADALAARCRAAGYAVDLACVDASLAPCGLPAGEPLTYGDLFRLAPYADTMVIRQLTPEALRALLDDNARRIGRPGEPPGERGFLHFSREVRYRVEMGTARSEMRAVDIKIPAPGPDGVLRVACSTFVRGLAQPWERNAASSGLILFDLCSLPAHDTGLLWRRELAAWVFEHGGVTEAAGAQRDGRLVI